MTDSGGREADGLPTNMVSDRHPHEPSTPPVLDDEGRCLVCSVEVRLQDIGQITAKLAHRKAIVTDNETGLRNEVARLNGLLTQQTLLRDELLGRLRIQDAPPVERPDTTGLDVERLALAIAPHIATYPPAVTQRERERDMRDFRAVAERVAAEYARLAATTAIDQESG